MWQAITNFFLSLRTYRDLSPDLRVRRRVNAMLKRSRPDVSFDHWAVFFAAATDRPPSLRLLRFVYQQLADYSGLIVGCIRPSDRLIEDLHLPLICWFDWPNQLCADFHTTFQVDISEDFDESLLQTVGDLVGFLQKKLQSMDSLAS